LSQRFCIPPNPKANRRKMKTKTFQIRGKRLHRENDDEYIFLTSGYGGKFFSIPKKDVICTRIFKKAINDVKDEDWHEFTVSEDIWIKRAAYRHYDEAMAKRGEMIIITDANEIYAEGEPVPGKNMKITSTFESVIGDSKMKGEPPMIYALNEAHKKRLMKIGFREDVILVQKPFNGDDEKRDTTG